MIKLSLCYMLGLIKIEASSLRVLGPPFNTKTENLSLCSIWPPHFPHTLCCLYRRRVMADREKKNPCSQVVKPWLFLNSDFERALTELHNWTSTGIHPPRDTCKDDVGPPHVRAKSADSESHNSVSTPSADCPLNEERNVVPSSTAARGGTGRREQRRGARPRRITGTNHRAGWTCACRTSGSRPA
jgi:hypothetical protein